MRILGKVAAIFFSQAFSKSMPTAKYSALFDSSAICLGLGS